jgi:membrane protease YdiL (CAAX protease family)
MATVDGGPRSAAVRALRPSRLVAVDMRRVRNAVDDAVYATVVRNLAAAVCDRMRDNHLVTVRALAAELAESRVRVASGVFVVVLLFVIALYTLALRLVLEVVKLSPVHAGIISAGFVVFMAAASFLVAWRSGYPLSDYGITLRHAGRHAWQAVLWTLPWLVLITLLKWWWVQSVATTRLAVFPILEHWNGSSSHSLEVHLLLLLAYGVLCPLQELAIRGVMQTSLLRLLGNPTGLWLWAAILLSNLVFAAVHVHMSVSFALVALLCGTFWGWMFHRQQSLVGVSLSHILIGSWGLTVLEWHLALAAAGY